MPPSPVTKVDFSSTKFFEPVKNEAIAAPATRFGPGYEVLFDSVIAVDGWKEIRVWVHVFADNYAATPVTSPAQLELRFMHNLTGGSFDYEKAIIPWSHFGYVVKPIIGKEISRRLNST